MNLTDATAPTNDAKARAPRLGLLDGLLGLSAAALFCLAIVQVGATSAFQPFAKGGSADRAGMLATVGEYTLLSVDIGNEDAILLLDGRAEEVLVYRADNQQVMQISQRMELPRTFTEARARSGAKGASAPESRDSAKDPARDNRSNPPR